jgi:hypothetical protein
MNRIVMSPFQILDSRTASVGTRADKRVAARA